MAILREYQKIALAAQITAMRDMKNLAMMEKLKTGEAIDVGIIGEPYANFPGVWRLENYLDNVDYCDSESEQWIWSIGRHKITGEIFAAVDARFTDNPMFDCLWLR